MTKTLKQILLISFLMAFVLLVNYSIISHDMMYLEQTTIYTAYHAIHHWQDLANVYLHPQFLHTSIPFFRPSGHFLLYQLIIPLIGWHNTKALIIVNLMFLALTGYFIIQLYRLLFPNYLIGGYIAFSFYLMHPALIMSRLIILHFEFAYVMFTVWSLYCFVLFCQKNNIAHTDIRQFRFKHLQVLILSLLLYAIAITFKEGAIPLGAAMLCYLYLALYQQQKLSHFIIDIFHNREILQITFLILGVSISLGLYLTLAWPHLFHPLRNDVKPDILLHSTKQFICMIFNTQSSFISVSNSRFCDMISPLITRVIIWILLGALLINTFLTNTNKKACLFLLLCMVLFLLIPLKWGMGQPWHLNLTLLFLGMLCGYSIENLGHLICKREKWIRNVGLIIALLIGASTYIVNDANIRHIYAGQTENKIIPLNYNAVFHPPNISNQLNRNSIIVVEDTTILDDYAIGNGSYPFILIGNFDYDKFARLQQFDFIKYHPIYNGMLFSWAYNIPTLREEIFPFHIEDMSKIPHEIIYEWLQAYNNIFCFGYDSQSIWHDRTAAFKQALLSEKTKRQLIVNSYHEMAHTAVKGQVYSVKQLPFPDHQFCQYACDQQTQCRGFTYLHAKINKQNIMLCYFYHAINMNSAKPCRICRAFIKQNPSKVST